MKINGTTIYDSVEIRDMYNGSTVTFAKCDELEKKGYGFVPGNNPDMDKTQKWGAWDLVRVAKTNDRRSGLCRQTLWAVKILACRA